MDHVIAALAHDIRTPLNAMALTLTLMEMKRGDRLDSEDREDMASMRAGITAVLDLHEGILDHARLSSGQTAVNATAFLLDGAIAALPGNSGDQACSPRGVPDLAGHIVLMIDR